MADIKAIAQQGVAAASANTQVVVQNDMSGKVEDILKNIMPKLAQASLANVKPEFIVSTALTVLRNNADLGRCDPLSIVHCVVQSAQTGLRLDPVLQQAALVSRWSSKKNRYEAQFMPMYRGLLLLSRRSGEIRHVAAQPVYSNDEFVYTYGNDQQLYHKPTLSKDRGDITHYYAYMQLKSGGFQFEVMTQDEINEVMEFALGDKKNKSASPWATDPIPVALKTVLRRLLKLAPIEDPLTQAALQADEMLDRGQLQQHEIVNGLVVPRVEFDQTEAPEAPKAYLPPPKPKPDIKIEPKEETEPPSWTRAAIDAIDALAKKGDKEKAQSWGTEARKKLAAGEIMQFDFDAILAAYRTAFPDPVMSSKPEPKPAPKAEPAPEKPKAKAKKKDVDVAAEIEQRIVESEKASILFTLKSQIAKAKIDEQKRGELMSLLNDKLAEITRKK